MSKFTNRIFPLITVVFISICLFLTYLVFTGRQFLTFSDGAKFALIAKNIVDGVGYGSNFTFYSPRLLSANLSTPFPVGGIPVLVPYTLSVFFRLFGVTDLAVMIFSSTFFILTVLMVYLLGKKIFGRLVGILAALAVASNLNFLDYATSGASETLYTFIALSSAYLIFLKNKWTDILFFVSLIFLYLTKPQGAVFILALLFTWFLSRFSFKKGFIYFMGLVVAIFLLDKLVLYPLSFRYPVYPIVTRGIQALFQYSPATAVSDALRGGVDTTVGWRDILVKTSYNLYNFYKLLPEIASPYMWGLFAMGLLIWRKDKKENVFKLLTMLVVVGSFLLAALTIPFFRYLHPVIPFVYIISTATLVIILASIIKSRRYVILTAVLLIFFFTIGQTIGVIFLDSRFEADTHNTGKPPVYVKLSWTLKDNTDKNQVIVTNLDTWGSWYGERKTVWFPLEPKMIINTKTGKIPFDAIYLTNYLIDDENYYMGDSWRMIFNNPEDSKKWDCEGCAQIAKEFKLVGKFNIASSENYERQDASAILLIKK